jgi:Cellulose biosynthesis protein BcsS
MLSAEDWGNKGEMTRLVSTWLIVLVPSVLVYAGTARAQYLPPASPHAAVSSSFDADSLGNRNVYLDATFAPFSGIYESGPRFRVMGNASWYRFVTNQETGTLGTGRSLEGGLLAGYGFAAPGFGVTWLVGPAFGETVNEGVVTDRWGGKASIEIYATPTDLTMTSASISYSTVTNYLQVQAKAGLKMFGDVYFGPEAKFAWQQILPFQVNFSSTAIATTTPVSPQTNIASVRVGGHISSFNIGPVALSISGGWAHDRELGSGYYGSVSFYQPF